MTASTVRVWLRRCWPTWLLVVLFVALEATSLDLAVQDQLFDFRARRWRVDGREPVGRILFYQGPKLAVAGVGLGLVLLLAGPQRWRDRWRFDRRELAIAVLTLASVPLVAGLGKAHTNTFCPSELRRYGGDIPYVKLCSRFPDGDRPERRGHCFPAGHASGGYALLGLAQLRPSRRWRLGTTAVALVAGSVMGGYQMLKGAHFLSHTVATLLLAVVAVGGWRLVFARPGDTGPHRGGLARCSSS